MLNLPGPGIKPMSPALTGRFLTTGPPQGDPSILIQEEKPCIHKTLFRDSFQSSVLNVAQSRKTRLELQEETQA